MTGERDGDSLNSRMQSDDGSVTGFLRDARLGRVLAIERLTDKYLGRLERFAKSRMSPSIRQVEDEQDVAINVLNEFFVGILNGKYDGLQDRKQLWRLLAKITVCRVIDHYEKYHAHKRGGGMTQNFGFSSDSSSSDFSAISQISIDEIDPQLSVGLKDSYERLLDGLDESRDQKIVQLTLEGLDNRAIAKRLGTSERNVRYRLDAIQKKLIDELKR